MKTNSANTTKTLRLIARIISAIILIFTLFMFFGYALEGAGKANPEPLTMYVMIQFTIFGVGLLGLAFSWKWELDGGVVALLAFIILFCVNTDALVVPMFIFPVNAILFIVAGYLSKTSKINRAH